MTLVEREAAGRHGRRRALLPGSLGRSLPAPVERVLGRGIGIIGLLPALVGTALVQALSPTAQAVPTGAARFTVAGAWAVLQPGALAGYGHWWDAAPWAWLQVGALQAALGGGTTQSVLAAVHGALFVVALVTVVLVWALARRLGASGIAAGAAALLFGITPVAVAVHATAEPAVLAAAWLLAAALCALAAPRGASLATGALGAVAVLTAPIALVAVPAVVWLLQRTHRADGRRGETTMLAAVGAAVVAAAAATTALVGGALGQPASGQPQGGAELGEIGRAAALQAPPLGLGASAAALWVTTDPLGLLLAIVAIGTAIGRRTAWPVASWGLLAAIASFWPLGRSATAPIAIALPALAVAVAAAVDVAIVALGRARFSLTMLGAGLLTGVVAVLGVGVGVWAVSLGQLRSGAAQPVARVEQWVRSSVPKGELVLVDLAAWPDLARVGGGAQVGWYTAAGPHAPTVASSPFDEASYVVADASLERNASGTASSVLARSVPVASFGTGTAELRVQAVAASSASVSEPAPSTPALRKATAARLAAGRELAANPRLRLSGDGRAMLEAGRVDTRLAIVLGQLLATHRVVVADFPAIAGKASDVRRQAVVSELDGRAIPADVSATGVLLRYLSGLRGAYAASSIDVRDDGVLVTFAADPAFVPSQ